MESTYTQRITSLVEENAKNFETKYIWMNSNVETEKEETIKYVDKEIAVPSKPEIIHVERLVTNVVEVKVKKLFIFYFSYLIFRSHKSLRKLSPKKN